MADTGLLSAAAIVIVALIHDTSALTGALAALVGIGIAAHSLLTARVLMLLTGAVNALIGLAVLYEQAIGFERIFNWGSLSALGILAVIGAAVAEKNRESLLAWLRSRQQSEVGT